MSFLWFPACKVPDTSNGGCGGVFKDTPALRLKLLRTLIGTNVTSDITSSDSQSFLCQGGDNIFSGDGVSSQCHDVITASSRSDCFSPLEMA